MEEKYARMIIIDNGPSKKAKFKPVKIKNNIPYCNICLASNVGLKNYNEFMFYGNILTPK